MQSHLKPLILVLTLTNIAFNTSIVGAGKKNNAKNQQNTVIENITDDTTKVNQLLALGYRFIDGPSDSLLFYFKKASIIIQNNLNELNSGNNSNRELIKTYNKLKTRALIEFGIEYFYQNDYEKALGYFNDALETAKLIEDSKTNLAIHFRLKMTGILK